MTDEDALVVSVHIEASAETVFPYFTDPSRYVQWMGRDAELEAFPGGTYRVRMRDGIEASGEFVEIDPPHRLVFTFGWMQGEDVAPGSSRVEVTLEPESEGTRVTLRHTGLPKGDQIMHHRAGWELYINRLQVRVQGGDPGPDPNGEAATAPM